jgi:putative lipoprotein
MKLVLVFSVLLAPPQDRWFGEDKLKHFVVSAFAQSISYSALQLAGAERGPALAGATVATLGAGVAKELVDHRRAGGAFSYKDLTWGLAGAGTATLWLQHTR